MDDSKKTYISIKYIDVLNDWLKENEVDRDDVCLVGSSALAARGLRENHDLEFVIKPDIRKKLKLDLKYDFFWLTFNSKVGDGIELWKNQLFRIGITDRRIFSEKLYDVIDGYNVVYLDIEKLYKQELNREKDIKDLKKIDSFVHEIKYSQKTYDRVCRTFFYIMEKIEFYLYSKWRKMRIKLKHAGAVMDENVHIILWP